MHKAVFLDKDGTIIHDLPYNIDPQKITWQSGSLEALKKLNENGYLLVIITNQSGVARGLFDEEDLKQLGASMKKILAGEGIVLSGFYFCPHHKEGIIARYSIDCDCRKPKPGMLLKASHELQIDLSGSWMVGDMLKDVEAGNTAGCRTVLINESPDLEKSDNNPLKEPDYKAKSILEAAEFIIKNELL